MKRICALAFHAAVAAAVPAIGSSTPGAGGTARPCTDPCFRAARAASRECASSASGAFSDALDGCLERDHACVDACRWNRVGCREDTGLEAELDGCRRQLAADLLDCRLRLRPGSIRLAACLDRAQLGAARCRRGARRRARRAVLACQATFASCVGACGAGAPPLGSDACRGDARSGLRAGLASCRRTFQATASACIGRDVACVPECTDAREACTAPARQAAGAALASCRAQETSAAQTCVIAYPSGSSELRQCVQAAAAAAYGCRDAAVEAAASAFAPCTDRFVGCLKACPPA